MLITYIKGGTPVQLNLAFATSHFVIELLPFDYLSNQKQWKSTINAFQEE
jgi:hypothetical protein